MYDPDNIEVNHPAESQAVKRFKGFWWIVLAGSVAAVSDVVIQNIDLLNFSEFEQKLLLIGLTALIAQITKYLNRKTN